jgi:hypothetical protein
MIMNETIKMSSDYNRQDIFGYYTVGKLKMYSQIEATEVSQRLNLPIDWHFNEEVFRHCDWTVEPKETISELYRKRCEQLREKYDYLALYYSGGADSDNILNHFIENNIKLDEVVSLMDYEGSQDRMSKTNAEIFEVAIPKIKEAQKKQPHLKHTIIDTTNFVLDSYKKLNLDQIYNQNTSFAPFTLIRGKVKYSQQHWKEMFSVGKKVGFIYGIEKPRVTVDDNFNFNYFFTSTTIAAATTPELQRENNPFDFTELFYWSPDFPKIPIKQSHIVKNFVKRVGFEGFKRYANRVNGVIRQPPSGLNYTLLHNGDYLINEELNRLIYPYWYNIPYQYKAINMILYEKEIWFIGKMNSEEQAKNWKAITQKVLEITKTDYKKQSFFNNAISASKLYNLGK